MSFEPLFSGNVYLVSIASSRLSHTVSESVSTLIITSHQTILVGYGYTATDIRSHSYRRRRRLRKAVCSLYDKASSVTSFLYLSIGNLPETNQMYDRSLPPTKDHQRSSNILDTCSSLSHGATTSSQPGQGTIATIADPLAVLGVIDLIQVRWRRLR